MSPNCEELLNYPWAARLWACEMNLLVGVVGVKIACGMSAVRHAGRSLGADGLVVRMFIEYHPTLIAHMLAVAGPNESEERLIDHCQVRRYVVERDRLNAYRPGVKEFRDTYDEGMASDAIAAFIIGMAFTDVTVTHRVSGKPRALDDPEWLDLVRWRSYEIAYNARVGALRYQEWEKRETLELGLISSVYDWSVDRNLNGGEGPIPCQIPPDRWGRVRRAAAGSSQAPLVDLDLD